jgi:TonB family protein
MNIRSLLFLVLIAVLSDCELTGTDGLAPTIDAGKNRNLILVDPLVWPSFPGGSIGLEGYLKENLRWPQGRSCSVGTVYVKFLVTEDGSVTDPVVLRGICEACDVEATRMVNKMPKWTPATLNGKPRSQEMIVPIRFSLRLDEWKNSKDGYQPQVNNKFHGRGFSSSKPNIAQNHNHLRDSSRPSWQKKRL